MRPLIIHEWVEPSGGAERVVDEFVRAFPTADLRVLWNDAPGRYNTIQESWLASTPLRRHKALALPLLPLTWRTLPMGTDYDCVLVSSHLFAHHFRATRRGAHIPKLSYVHTPARYIWEPELDRRGASPIVRAAASILKPIDRRRAHESKALAANSRFTAERIARVWEMEATVIYPPVDVDAISAEEDWAERIAGPEIDTINRLPDNYLLGASRFVPYKRLDLVIAAGEATGLPVVIAGSGPMQRELTELAQSASVPVLILTRPSDELLRALYQRALAFVFPAVEDFGIMPVEAMAAGTPVVTVTHGGAAESVTMLDGGALVEPRSKSDWISAVSIASTIDRRNLRARTSRFSASRFREEVSRWVHEAIAN